MGPGAQRHVQSEQDPVQLPGRSAAGARAQRAGRLPLDLAAEAAPGHAAALGRQQRDGRGAQQERSVRHRHDTADDRSRRDRAPRAMAADGGAAEVSLCHRQHQGCRRGKAVRGVLRRLPWRQWPQLQRAGWHGSARMHRSEREGGRPVRPAGRQDHAHRIHRHRSAPARFLLLRPRGQSGDGLRGLPASLLPLSQDLRLRQHAARRHLAARALPAQRLGADAARPARTLFASARSSSIAATTSTTRPRSASSRTPGNRAAGSSSPTTPPSPAIRMRGTKESDTAPNSRPPRRTRWSSS